MGAAIALPFLLAGAVPAVADGGDCPDARACLAVTVVGTVNESFTVTPDQLDRWHDMDSPPYRTGSPTGVQDDPPGESTSINAILNNLDPAALAAMTYVETSARADSHVTRLDRSELKAPYTGTGYQNDVAPGYFAGDGDAYLHFVRPMRSDDDQNYLDVWEGNRGAPVHLTVHTSGRVLRPTIHASSTTVEVGTPVQLSVTWSGGDPDSPRLSWGTGDGATSSAASPTHTWTAAGTYYVTLDATAPDGSAGSATPVVVRVGAAPPASSGNTQQGSGTGGPTHTVTGPVKGKGHTAGSTTSTSGTDSVDHQAASGATTSTTASTSPKSGRGKHKRDDASGVKKQRVSGVVLVSAGAVAPVEVSTKASPAESARVVPHPRRDWRWLGVLALPGLLLLGSAGQSRWLHRRLPTVPWRIT